MQPFAPAMCASRQVEELRTMLDMDGDGLVSFQELLATIKEAFSARGCGASHSFEGLSPGCLREGKGF